MSAQTLDITHGIQVVVDKHQLRSRVTVCSVDCAPKALVRHAVGILKHVGELVDNVRDLLKACRVVHENHDIGLGVNQRAESGPRAEADGRRWRGPRVSGQTSCLECRAKGGGGQVVNVDNQQ